MDATPEARLAPAAQSRLGRWWGWAGGVWHDWEFTWYARVIGYDDDAQRLIVRNSWGKGWGQAGYFTLPYAYLTEPNLSDDFWTVRLIAA